MNNKITLIKRSIDSSHTVVASAIKENAPKVSEQMGLLGKPITDRALRHHWEISLDVKRTNFLARLKQFWGGSYLTRFALGETIWTDLSYFRSIFTNPFWRRESSAAVFFRINKLWIQITQAFFEGEQEKLESLVRDLCSEIYKFRAAIDLDRAEKTKRIASSVANFKGKFFSLFKYR